MKYLNLFEGYKFISIIDNEFRGDNSLIEYSEIFVDLYQDNFDIEVSANDGILNDISITRTGSYVNNKWVWDKLFDINIISDRINEANDRLLSMGYKQLECIVYAGDSVKNIVDFNKPYEIKFCNHPSLPNGNYIDTSKYKPCRFEKFEDCLYAINQQREFEKKNKIINPFGVGQKSTDIFSILLRYKFIG